MKKILAIAASAFIFTSAMAHGGKDCSKGKDCCKKNSTEKACCKKDSKTTSAKAVKITPKKA